MLNRAKTAAGNENADVVWAADCPRGHFEHLQYFCPSTSLHPHLTTKNGSFHSHSNATKENKIQNNDNQQLIFPKVVQQHYVGEVGKSITFMCLFSQYTLC